jgi:hypothetical protein
MAVLLLVLVMVGSACSDDAGSSGGTIAAVTLPATVCATDPAPDGRLVHVTLDDVVGGFGSFGSRSDSGLTPGVVRVELEADGENAAPASVRILLGDAQVASIDGVAAGQTCGIDVTVEVGTYRVVDDAGDRDVEFDVVAG